MMTARPHPTPGRLTGIVLGLTLLGAGLEVVVMYFQKRSQPFVRVSEDVVWMAPLALLAISSVALAAGSLAFRLRPRAGAALALFLSSGAIYLNLLMLVPRLMHVAAAILATGLAVQTTRLVLGHFDAVSVMVRRLGWRAAAISAIAGVLIWNALRFTPPAPAVSASPAGSRPNLLVITLDTVRAQSLGLYGFAGRTTPHLDGFAARGVTFDHAFSTSAWTLPSHASLFTGRWPHELSTSFTTGLDGTHPTLAEYLATRGYRTAGFVANLGYVGAESGLGRGFQHYEDYPRSIGQAAASSTIVRTLADNFRLRRLIRNDQHLSRVSAADLNARALAWLSAHADAPFFVFLNYFDAHEPYLPPPPYDRRFGGGRREGRHSPLHHWLWNPAVAHANMGDAERVEEVDAYHGAIAYLDDQLNALLQALEHRGQLANTFVVITSDHGEEFGEHGVYEHGYSLYRAGVHVPLVIVAPGRLPSRRVAAPVSLRDVPSTIVELLGAQDGQPFPGASLSRLWRDGDGTQTPADSFGLVLSEVSPSPGQPSWFPSSRGDMKSVLVRGLRYIRNGDGSEELYDLTGDPGERRNLISVPEHQPALMDARALAGAR
jgi:arylsulfatase A-like enzyme